MNIRKNWGFKRYKTGNVVAGCAYRDAKNNLMNRKTILLSILILSMTDAFACNCIGVESVKTSVKKSAIVVKGLVISRETMTYVDTLIVLRTLLKRSILCHLLPGNCINTELL